MPQSPQCEVVGGVAQRGVVRLHAFGVVRWSRSAVLGISE